MEDLAHTPQTEYGPSENETHVNVMGIFPKAEEMNPDMEQDPNAQLATITDKILTRKAVIEQAISNINVIRNKLDLPPVSEIPPAMATLEDEIKKLTDEKLRLESELENQEHGNVGVRNNTTIVARENEPQKAEGVREVGERAPEELKETRRMTIVAEIVQKWEIENGPMERPMTKAEIEGIKSWEILNGREWDGGNTRMTDAASEFFFDHKGGGKNSVPGRAEKILLERYPEYTKKEEPVNMGEGNTSGVATESVAENLPEQTTTFQNATSVPRSEALPKMKELDRPISVIEEKNKYENREVSDAFREAGMPLDSRIVDMLEESPEHQGGRRGSGFTQASRYMANIIRRERSISDIGIFDASFIEDIEDEYFRDGNEEKLRAIDFRDYVNEEKLKEISKKVKGVGSKLLLGIIYDIFDYRDLDTNLTHLPSSSKKLEIGTCTTAENYFFDYIRGGTYKGNFESKSARMNIFKDEKGDPLFMEKIGLGENHSAISLKDFYLNGIKIPAGSLVALQYERPIKSKLTNSKNGDILNSNILQAVEFLRFTTLVVDPKDREQTFGAHLQWQKEYGIKGSEDLTLREVIDRCKREVLGNI